MSEASEDEAPLIPARMLNEFVYCPRLAILEWVEGEFLHSADTVAGALRHRTVDRPGKRFRKAPRSDDEASPAAARARDGGETPAPASGVEQLRAVDLSDPALGLIAKLDLVEIEGKIARPVDVKKGKRPHVARDGYDPERVQVCAQGLLLRAQGWTCDRGILYFAGSGERVEVVFDDALVEQTRAAIRALRSAAEAETLPPPLEDSPKCVRCSLAPICLPDETLALRNVPEDAAAPSVRRLYPMREEAAPLYIQEQVAPGTRGDPSLPALRADRWSGRQEEGRAPAGLDQGGEDR